MAWYPEAIRKNIPPGSTDPVIKPIGVIFHVRAGTGSSLFPYFNGPSGGIESHFYIRFDGTVEQYRDTGREADANYKGNSFIRNGVRCGFLSVETEGVERGEWTDAQVASLKALTLWASKIHAFPLRVCPAWNSPGVGYHVLFGAPGPWTPVAKSCPGPDRVRQFRNIFVPWLSGNHQLPDTGTPEKDWFDMATLADLEKAVQNALTTAAQPNGNSAFQQLLEDRAEEAAYRSARKALIILLDEAANRSSETGRAVSNDLWKIVRGAAA